MSPPDDKPALKDADIATELAAVHKSVTSLTAKLKVLMTPLVMVWTVVVAVIGFLSGGVTIWANIRGAARAEAREVVMADRFIGELAEKIRPGCVFDSTGAITANFGAAELIEGIQVDTVPKSYGFKITMKFKKLVEKEPIVTGLSVNVFPEEATPGPMNTWTFSLGPATTLPSIIAEGASSPSASQVYKFKLEILR